MARSTIIEVPPGGPRPAAGDAFADALQDRRVDLEIVYCSGRDRFAKLLPTARMTPFPPGLQVGPEYALAVLENGDPLWPNSLFMCSRPKARAFWHDQDLPPSLCPKSTADSGG